MRKLVYAGLILCFSFLLIAAGCQVTQQPPRPTLSQTDTVTYASTFTNLVMQVDASVVSWARTKHVTGLSSAGLKGSALLRAKETETGPDALGYMHVVDEADNFLGHYVSNYYYKKVKDAQDNVTDYFLYGIVKITSTSSSSSTGGSTSTYTLMLGKNVTNPPQTPENMSLDNQIQFHATYYTDENGPYPWPPDRSKGSLRTMTMSGKVSLNIQSGSTTVALSTELDKLETPEYGPPKNGKLMISAKVDGTDYAPIEVEIINALYYVKVLGISLPFGISSEWFGAAKPPFHMSGFVTNPGNWGTQGGTLRLYAVPTFALPPLNPPNNQWDPPFTPFSNYSGVISQFPVRGYVNVPSGSTTGAKFTFYPPDPIQEGPYYIFARFFKNAQDHGPDTMQGDEIAAGEFSDGSFPKSPEQISSCSPTMLTFAATSSASRDDINFQTNLSYTASGGGGTTISGKVLEDMSADWGPMPKNLLIGVFTGPEIENRVMPWQTVASNYTPIPGPGNDAVTFSFPAPPVSPVYVIAVWTSVDMNQSGANPKVGDVLGQYSDGLMGVTPPNQPTPVTPGVPLNPFSIKMIM